jgi:hypothetical protein
MPKRELLGRQNKAKAAQYGYPAKEVVFCCYRLDLQI